MILPSRWLPAIRGGEDQSPVWPNENEIGEFTRAVFALYNQVMQGMNEDIFEALFLERSGRPLRKLQNRASRCTTGPAIVPHVIQLRASSSDAVHARHFLCPPPGKSSYNLASKVVR